MKIKVSILIAFCAVVTGLAWYTLARQDTTKEQTNSVSQPTPKPSDKTKTEPLFDKTTHSIDDPASIWAVVNKQRPLDPKSYMPSDLVFPDVRQRVPGTESMRLRSESATALEALFAGASNDGIELMLSSGHRSYNYQVSLYGNYVKTEGQAKADTESARPGYSEHQTGLAVDVRPINGQCDLEQCFGEMPEGKWVAAHAHEYGFIIRYPEGLEQIVGYKYEPWHVRYIGKEAAAEYIRTNTQTLEEFFGLPPAPDYSS